MSFLTDAKNDINKLEKAVESSPVGPLFGEVMTNLSSVSETYGLTLEHLVSAFLDALYTQYGEQWLIAHALNRPAPAPTEPTVTVTHGSAMEVLSNA